jgi:BMFP domain-containing protein YqiC
MQTENRLLDDLARMANGALNTLSGLREEIESRVRERVERMLADMDMVTREEFEAVRAMAQKARSEQEEMAATLAELERRVAGMSASDDRPKAAARAATGGRTARAKAGTAKPKAGTAKSKAEGRPRPASRRKSADRPQPPDPET